MLLFEAEIRKIRAKNGVKTEKNLYRPRTAPSAICIKMERERRKKRQIMYSILKRKSKFVNDRIRVGVGNSGVWVLTCPCFLFPEESENRCIWAEMR